MAGPSAVRSMRALREIVSEYECLVGILPPYIVGAAPAARDRGQVEKMEKRSAQQVQGRSSALACKDREMTGTFHDRRVTAMLGEQDDEYSECERYRIS